MLLAPDFAEANEDTAIGTGPLEYLCTAVLTRETAADGPDEVVKSSAAGTVSEEEVEAVAVCLALLVDVFGCDNKLRSIG